MANATGDPPSGTLASRRQAVLRAARRASWSRWCLGSTQDLGSTQGRGATSQAGVWARMRVWARLSGLLGLELD